MNVTKTQSDKNVTLLVEGRLDTMTSPNLEKEILSISESAESLTIDFS